MKSCLTLLLLVSFFTLLTAQSPKDTKITYRQFVSGNLLGAASIVGISYERMVSNKLTWEVGLGVGIGAGISYYPKEIQKAKWCFYTGFKLNSAALVGSGGGYGGYIPFGMTYFSKTGFNFGVDLGPALGNINDQTQWLPYGNIKLGIRI